MKPITRFPLDRRVLLSSLAILPVLSASLRSTAAVAQAQRDPLPSWNEGATKASILDFVARVTTQGGPFFVPVEQRIATFDNDGTLWVEQPMYTQVMFALHQVGVMAQKDPKMKDVEPFKTVLSGDRAAMAKLTVPDLEKILAITHTGMTVEAFQTIVQDWIAKAKHQRFERPYTELVYQPMLEVMQYLRANGYRTYIGGGYHGRDEVRLRQNRQTNLDQGAEALAERQ